LYKLAIAEIDPDMIGYVMIVNAKEYQITAFQLAFLDRCSMAQVAHFFGGAWYLDFHYSFISVVN